MQALAENVDNDFPKHYKVLMDNDFLQRHDESYKTLHSQYKNGCNFKGIWEEDKEKPNTKE